MTRFSISAAKVRGVHHGIFVFFVVVSCLFLGTSSSAQQVVLQNDSVTDFGNVTIQAGFVGGEKAAAWLTSSCDGSIVAVQILLLSTSGTAPDALEDSIKINDAGVFPIPGAVELASISGPQLSDGFFNEFLLPAPVPVLQGSTYVVTLVFDAAPLPNGPSVVTDTDGCQDGKNGIFAIPPVAWFSSCLLGVTGDFAIRAVVECDDNQLIFRDGFESGDTLMWLGTVF